MAQQNLRAAAEVASRHPDRARGLGIDEEETARWRDAAEAMYVPYDDTLGVHPQGEGFTGHQVWDFAATTTEQYPLLLHFPYFDLYRKQVVKQADLVLAMHRRGDAFALVAGFAGMRDRDGTLSFAPRLPDELSRLALKVSLRRRRLAVDVRAATATYTLLDGEPMRIVHHGQQITASLNDPIVLPIAAAAAESPTPTQPPGREPRRHAR